MSEHAKYQRWRREAKKAEAAGQPAPPRPEITAEELNPASPVVPCCWACGENRIAVLVTYQDRVLCGNCIVLEKREDRRGLIKVLNGNGLLAPGQIPCPRCEGPAMHRPQTDPPEYMCLSQGRDSDCWHRWVHEPTKREAL